MTAELVGHFAKYSRDVLKNGDYALTVHDQNKFIKASVRVKQFLEENVRRIPRAREMLRRPYQQADLLYNALTETVSGMELTPGFFCSDMTFKTRIPQYLRAKEMWGPEE